jgi:hypothetical protein
VKDIIRETQLGWVCENEAELAQWFESYLAAPQKVRAYQTRIENMKPYQLAEICRIWKNFVDGAL